MSTPAPVVCLDRLPARLDLVEHLDQEIRVTAEQHSEGSVFDILMEYRLHSIGMSNGESEGPGGTGVLSPTEMIASRT